jgi:hypothetical protein
MTVDGWHAAAAALAPEGGGMVVEDDSSMTATSAGRRDDRIEPTSVAGPLRHFAATQQFGRFRSEADIQRAALTARIYEYGPK